MSNLFDQFDSAGTSAATQVPGNIFDQFDGVKDTTPGHLFRPNMGIWGAPIPGAASTAPAAGMINTIGTGAGMTVGGLAGGGLGAMAGAALGRYAAGQLNSAIGAGPPATKGEIAGSAVTALGGGPIAAPLTSMAGGTLQSVWDGKGVPSAKQLAIMAAGGEAAALLPKAIGTSAGPTGSQVTRDATLAEGQAAGYVLPPNEINPSLANNVGGSVAGKADLKAASKIKNQQTTNTLAAQAIGLDPAQPITPAAIQSVKDAANKAYAQVAALSPEAAGTLEDLKQARFDSKANFQFYARNGDPAVLKTAQQASQDAQAAEQLLEQEAAKTGDQPLVDNLRQARVTLAKANVVDTALNEATGNISAPMIGRMFDKGMPLTGELGTIGKFQQAFPLYTGEAEGTAMPGVSKLSIPEAVGAAYIGHEKFGAPGLAAGILPFTPPIARAAMLSSPYQRFFGRPVYSQPPSGLAANLARFAGQQAALTPNMSLLQPSQ